MSEQYSFNESNYVEALDSTVLVHDGAQIIWQTEPDNGEENLVNTSNITLSDSYMAVEVGENTTQYFSVLDSTNDTILNNISHINDGTTQEIVTDDLNEENGTDQEIVLFHIDGSDDLYGLQVIEDQDGNLQKCQFQVRQNEDGQIEPVPGTIQIIPVETEEATQLDESADQSEEETAITTEEPKFTSILSALLHAGKSNGTRGVHNTDSNQVDTDNVYVKEENSYDETSEDDETLESELHIEEEIVNEDSQQFDTKEGILNSSHSPAPIESLIVQPQMETEETIEYEEEPGNGELQINESPETDADYCEEPAQHEDNDSDETYQVEGVHVTAEDEVQAAVIEEVPEVTKPKGPNIILRPHSADKTYKAKKRLITSSGLVYYFSAEKNCYFAAKATEKENVTILQAVNSNNNVTGGLKSNPRSLLKTVQTQSKIDLVQEDTQQRRILKKNRPTPIRKMQNSIIQPTILRAPVRQERLPRKQKIELCERPGDKIVVQEISVSANGYIETREDGVLCDRRPLIPTATIKVSDSDDRTDEDSSSYSDFKARKKHRRRKSKRKQSLVEIVISDSEEDENSQNYVSPPKRPRGRPPKNPKSVVVEDKKVSDEFKMVHKIENKCPRCPKSFPSIGSLRSHMQFHNFEKPDVNNDAGSSGDVDQKPAETVEEVPTRKHSCKQCGETFKNQILLNGHVRQHKDVNKCECAVCKKLFPDRSKLVAHKRVHMKERMFKNTTTVLASPKRGTIGLRSGIKKAIVTKSDLPSKRMTLIPKRTTLSPSKSKSALKCSDCPRTFSLKAQLGNHQKLQHKKLICGTCSSSFASKLLLDTHIRDDCVKKPVKQFLKPVVPSYVPRKSVMRSPQTRSSTRLSTRSSRIGISSAGINLKIKCDSCEQVFASHTLLYKHKVLNHGLNTPNRDLVKDKKVTKHTPEAHSGIKPNPRLRKTFASLSSKLESLGKD